MSHWQQGKTIQGGKYVIAKVLGYGGAGVTYCAQDRSEKRWVAIKTLNETMQSRKDFQQHQERFIQEAFRLAKCSHPHVIRVDDVFQEGHLWCMIMEYLAGGNLRQYAISKGGLHEAEALRYIQEVGSALDYVHRQGFLHRDVKPANIMLRAKTMQAVLIDFGLARGFVLGKDDNHTNSLTESFAPMEQYERKGKRGPYTDVYALAATFYYVLTLKLPLPAPFIAQGNPLIPPQKYSSQISDRVNEAIIKGMEIQPNDRPASIPAWLEMLTSSQVFIPVPTIPQVPASPLPVPTPQHLGNPSPVEKMPVHSRSDDRTHSPSQTTPKQSPARLTTRSPLGSSGLRVDTSAPTASPVLNISWESVAGIDYEPLQKFIAQAKFRDADQETAKILLQLAAREKEGWLDKVHVDNLPCEDLRIVDQLWLAGTNNRFGFSVQKQLYLSLGGTLEQDADKWKIFCDRVGWRHNNRTVSYKDLTFGIWAVEGHLPMLGLQIWGFTGWFSVLMKRLDACQI
ncbi:MAG: protein kinase domain-containing protein [Microcystaceae cyanobacterium]